MGVFVRDRPRHPAAERRMLTFISPPVGAYTQALQDWSSGDPEGAMRQATVWGCVNRIALSMAMMRPQNYRGPGPGILREAVPTGRASERARALVCRDAEGGPQAVVRLDRELGAVPRRRHRRPGKDTSREFIAPSSGGRRLVQSALLCGLCSFDEALTAEIVRSSLQDRVLEGLLEMAFDHNSHLYVYEVQPDWYEEFLETCDEITTMLPVGDGGDSEDGLGGFYSNN